MDHDTYSALKTIKSIYNKEDVLSKANEHWPLVKPHVETASKNYSIEKLARKEKTSRGAAAETA